MRIGIRGGGAISSVLYSPQVQVDQAQATHADVQKAVNTYLGGCMLEFKAGKTIVIRPGIGYVKKGWQIEENNRGRTSTFQFLRKYDINYIQVPVNVLLTSPLANGKVYIGIGPYVAYAMNGSVKVGNEMYDLEFKKFNEPVYTYISSDSYRPIQFVNHYSINRFDYGGTGVVGYEFSAGLFLEAGIDIGARQISTSYERYSLQWNGTIRDPGSSVRYSIVQLSAGWMINFKNYHKRR